MIVKMKKVTLLTESRYREVMLLHLRQLGVLHPRLVDRPGSEDIIRAESELEKTDKALSLVGNGDESKMPAPDDDPAHSIKTILDRSAQRDHLSQELDKNLEMLQWYENWGEMSYESLQTLNENGLFLRFYVSDESSLEDIESDKLYFVIKDEQKTVRFVFVTRDEDEQLDFREDPIPEIELSTLKDEIARLNKEISQIDSLLQDLGSVRPALNDYKAELQKTLEFNHVAHSMDGQDTIIYLQGYCPEDAVPRIEKMAQSEGVGYVIEDPDTPEDVPTLIRNPKWMRIIDPLFKFMGTLPGYNEQDISLTFLAFFSLFYAMLVGDAGYGLIIVGATWLFSRKNKTAPREGFRLMYLLGFTTILWGLFSGTWFGSEALSHLPILRAFIIDEIYSFSDVNQNILMNITFIIGAVHLSVARLLAAFKKINSPTAIGELGWVAVLWSIYFIANSFVLGKPLPDFVGILFLVGVILIGFFTHFQKNVLKGFLQTLSNLPLDIINTFSDVVSYIRLFAVGLATVIVASSFNEMAIGTGIDSILGAILAVIVLLLGHALNITLAMMSVLVHGVRLNMLEFSGHVGIQWSGKKYTPFKE